MGTYGIGHKSQPPGQLTSIKRRHSLRIYPDNPHAYRYVAWPRVGLQLPQRRGRHCQARRAALPLAALQRQLGLHLLEVEALQVLDVRGPQPQRGNLGAGEVGGSTAGQLGTPCQLVSSAHQRGASPITDTGTHKVLQFVCLPLC